LGAVGVLANLDTMQRKIDHLYVYIYICIVHIHLHI
jgi:hypothetical protein